MTVAIPCIVIFILYFRIENQSYDNMNAISFLVHKLHIGFTGSDNLYGNG